MICSLPEFKPLDTSVRTEVANQLIHSLQNFVTDSTACLRGSLERGTADAYSDIDLLWEVDDAQFPFALNHLRDTLSAVRPIRSLRIDPEFRNSLRHRVVFIRFEELPLFWRVDLEIFAKSVNRNPDCDPRSGDFPPDWSLAESALANAIAAIKACKRNNAEMAQQLLERAFSRVGLHLATANVRDALLQLTARAREIDPSMISLADDIEQLIRE